MRIAITGAAGQLGRELKRAFAGHDLILFGHADLELRDPATTAKLVASRADLVLHPAAMTNVDGCARDPEMAYQSNGLGTRYVALACHELGIPMVYISTNEVFDGSASLPYREYDAPRPVNAYGSSKWVGEQAVRELVPHHYIARVAWLYGGERNFVRTVLRLAAERPSLTMVADEIGSPTYAADAADAIAALVQTRCYGTYHIVNAGGCSRYDLAAETLRLAGNTACALHPMQLAEYKRDSVVPPYTVLQNSAAAALGITLRPWQAALAAYLATLDSVPPV